jgi:glucokinase
MLLAGDIGATKMHLALYQRIEGRLQAVRNARFATKQYHALEDIISHFLRSDKISTACLGVPGPVIEGRSQMANLPWLIDSRKLSAHFGIERVYLLNDLETHGYAISKLSADQLCTLNKGDMRKDATQALIAAGTGLGETFLTWDGKVYTPHPSEGGHVDFAPRTDDELDLLRYLMRKYGGRVSIERVVSGTGISNIYEFLRNARGMEEPGWLAEELAEADDPNTVIARNALAGKSALCEKALDMFAFAYGAEAGNFGLTVMSAGGLYIGGGIAPRILEKLKDGNFWRAFTSKGRLRRLLTEMPVHVILEKDAALIGVVAYADVRVAERDNVRGFE